MRIARIFVGDPCNKKGVFNSVHGRAKALQLISGVIETVYIVQLYRPIFFWKKQKKEKQFVYDGVTYKCIYIPLYFIDYVLKYRLRWRSIFLPYLYAKLMQQFVKYDCVLSHNIDVSKYLCIPLNQKYNIPFIATYHGSDIHTTPFQSSYNFECCSDILRKSSFNIFVSNALRLKAEEITALNTSKNIVIYDGIDSLFYKYGNDKVEQLKMKYNVRRKYIVSFVGNLIDVKNVLVLPKIFSEIYKVCQEVEFWIVGDGILKAKLQDSCEQCNVCVRFWGNVDPFIVPDLMNLTSVLLLPSKNEGLPRVTLEARACGCAVFASKVGGIAEAIGEENVFDLDKDFVDSMAQKVIEILEGGQYKSSVPISRFIWERTSNQELQIVNSVVSH